MGSVRTICLGEQTSHLYIECNLSSSQKTWAVVPTKVGIKSEDYATMEHEGVTSPCSFFFLPFRAVYQPRPKGQPTPPAGVSSKQILNGKESLSCTFPAGGLPSNRTSRTSQRCVPGRTYAASQLQETGAERSILRGYAWRGNLPPPLLTYTKGEPSNE